MGSASRTTPPLLWAVVAALAVVATTVQGQGNGDEQTCAAKLTACVSYLNGTTTPPASCCTPLKDAVTNQKACLCALYATPGILKGIGINMTQAVDLPIRCKISSDPDPNNFCKGAFATVSPPSLPVIVAMDLQFLGLISKSISNATKS